MAITRLSDVVVPEVFNAYMLKETKETSNLFNSGIITHDQKLASFLSGGGANVKLPFWKDLDNTESGSASDDPAEIGVAGKIEASKDMAIRQIRTRGWSTADLTAELAGDDPMKRIVQRSGQYWVRQFQRILIATATGVFAANIANNAGDMVLDISAELGDAAKLSPEAIIDAAGTMGDVAQELKAVSMHSDCFRSLQKQDLIDFIPSSKRADLFFPMYMGYHVIVDDLMPFTGAGANRIYDIYMYAQGGVAFAESPVAMPVEVERKADAGNGMGIETLWTRRQFGMHIYGNSFLDTTVAKEFPTNAELALAANWNRVYPERKQVPLAMLRCKV